MTAAGERYICVNCGYIYDLTVGDSMNGVPPGVPFAALPEEWVCPMCYVAKEQFDLFD